MCIDVSKVLVFAFWILLEFIGFCFIISSLTFNFFRKYSRKEYTVTAVNQAKRMLELYWDYQIPVDVDAIAEQVGVRVRYAPYLEGGRDISGRFDMINGQAICSVRTTDTETRQRFTLAHELGHFVLGHGGGFRDNEISLSGHFDYREVEANAFAAELLMPKIAVDHLIEKENIKNVDELAEWFNVSSQAMHYRLLNLGWL